MDFEKVYLNLVPLATTFGVGYETAQGDWSQVIGYSIITAMFLGENIFRKLDNSKTLETKV